MKQSTMLLKSLLTVATITASVSAMADEPKPLAEVKPYLNQEYIPFAKEWMKTSSGNKVFQFLGALTGTDSQAYSRENDNQISRTFNGPSSNVVEQSLLTFNEYCAAHGQQVKKLKSEAFCVNPAGTATARMKWIIDDAKGRDGGGSYTRYNVTFVHQSNSVASKAYTLLTSYAPGDNIKTNFGPAMVIDRKDGGLLQVQLRGNETRWITTDDVVLTSKELE